MWWVGLKVQSSGKNRPGIVSVLVKDPEFEDYFHTLQSQNTYLISEEGEIVISPRNPTFSLEKSVVSKAVVDLKSKMTSSAGVFSYNTPNNEEWLVALSGTGVSRWLVMTVVPKNAALRAVRILWAKSALFLLFLFFCTVFISFFGANYLTQALKTLFEATKKIGQGDFDLKVQVKSEDENQSLG